MMRKATLRAISRRVAANECIDAGVGLPPCDSTRNDDSACSHCDAVALLAEVRRIDILERSDALIRKLLMRDRFTVTVAMPRRALTMARLRRVEAIRMAAS